MKLIDTWRRLSARDQIVAIVAALAVAAALAVMIKVGATPPKTLLYAGLDSAAAGEILAALEAQDVQAEVRGDAIFVPTNRRDALRMALARDGLPRQGQAGFELLDAMNGFSTSSDLFDATYWRAKEGELARTILATPGVRLARVHIAAPKRVAFARREPLASASVTVSMMRGALSVEQATAIRFLVALAVPGLASEQVAVIDTDRGVVLAPGGGDAAMSAGAELDQERALELALVDLLEARVGIGNARIKVAIELTREQETMIERTIDPQSRVVMSSEATEASEADRQGSGVVTVASNLPEGDVDAATTPGGNQRSETREMLRYDASERRRETVIAPGGRKRVQVAAMINEIASRGEDGALVFKSRSPEELKSLQNLIAAAVGFDEARGDVVTVESLAFDLPTEDGEIAERNAAMSFLSANAMGIVQLVVPAIVLLVLGLFVLKPLLAPSGKAREIIAPATLAPAARPAMAGPAAAELPPPTPVEELSRIATERKSQSTAVLKDWLNEAGTAA